MPRSWLQRRRQAEADAKAAGKGGEGALMTGRDQTEGERQLHGLTVLSLFLHSSAAVEEMVSRLMEQGPSVTGAVFIYLSLGSLGFRMARSRKDDLFGIFGLKPRAAGVAPGEVSVIDTSALIDGRIGDLVRTGFVSGTLLVHEGVLRELQAIADSSDAKRRTRGRRGLDVLAEIQGAPTVDVVLVEEAVVGDVDASLVRLARERGGMLITVDANLAKVAAALSVPVRQINELASAFRVPFSPGEEISVQLVREGKEHGQGVGYLEDGTMVVVEQAADRIGAEVSVRVSNVIQTSTGRMVFAALADAGPA